MEIIIYIMIIILYFGLPASIIFFIIKCLSNQKKIKEELKYLNSTLDSLVKKVDYK